MSARYNGLAGCHMMKQRLIGRSRSLKEKWPLLAVCIAIPLFAGVTAGFLTRDSVEIFAALNQPFLSPPGWVFPVVWTILYVLMGISSYLVLTSSGADSEKRMAIILYIIQLFMNVLWPVFFFRHGLYLFSFIWLVLLWAVIYAYIKQAMRLSMAAGIIMIPYLLWVFFAGYLNLGIFWLNQM